jgi:hypothetical protein
MLGVALARFTRSRIHLAGMVVLLPTAFSFAQSALIRSLYPVLTFGSWVVAGWLPCLVVACVAVALRRRTGSHAAAA